MKQVTFTVNIPDEIIEDKLDMCEEDEAVDEILGDMMAVGSEDVQFVCMGVPRDKLVEILSVETAVLDPEDAEALADVIIKGVSQ